MRNDIFGSLLSYVAPGFRIMHKFDLNNPENLDFLNTLSSAVKNITLTTLMGMIGEKSSPSGLEKPPKYQETNIRRRKLAKGDKNKMKRIEQEVVAQRIVVPKVNKIRSMLPIDQQLYRV